MTELNNPIPVSPKDGKCRECGGPLAIIEVEDDLMTVMCGDCEDCYDVETDAFGDACTKYWPEAMSAAQEQGE